jgi:hypothetical protein
LFPCRKEDSDLYESVEHLDQTDQEAKNYSFVEKPSNKLTFKFKKYSQTGVQRPLLFKGCSSKISIDFGLMGFRPVVVDKWSLFRGGL